MKKYSLKGKYAVITGASSGIGKALSECFAKEGAHLVLGCIPPERKALEEWAACLRAQFGVCVKTIPLDLAVDDGPEKFHAEARRLAPRIEVLVNNAGVIAYGNFHEIPLEQQDRLIRINLVGYFKLMRLFVADMVAAGGGRVLNVSSVSAFQTTPLHAVYGAVKAFVQSLSEAVRQELKGTGVTVCTLNPTYTDTPLLRGGGFPKDIWWFRISGRTKPERVALLGTRAFIKGKPVYIPGVLNKFIHLILPRLLPRRMANMVAMLVLREK